MPFSLSTNIEGLLCRYRDIIDCEKATLKNSEIPTRKESYQKVHQFNSISELTVEPGSKRPMCLLVLYGAQEKWGRGTILDLILVNKFICFHHFHTGTLKSITDVFQSEENLMFLVSKEVYLQAQKEK